MRGRSKPRGIMLIAGQAFLLAGKRERLSFKIRDGVVTARPLRRGKRYWNTGLKACVPHRSLDLCSC